ncbi:MAG: DUF1800 domain-containing protein [Leptolyngbya foveolarum]|uniref:DUF1800 domain-containing protein n=1 Tax=Leptolyngbya foveolarum TaxID=47253 RepID=A0A2W4VUQ1_9CYAN|nr:MAG: DUF1800 domain-containing protein [Leptolyngbya foveolarum]
MPVDADQKITHVLDRLSLGARPGDRAKINKTGIDAYIQSQVKPANETEPNALAERLKGLSTLSLSPLALFKGAALPKNPSEAQKKKASDWRQQVIKETEQARLLRAMESPHQLREMMVDFWFNHFNVFVHKDLTAVWLGHYEQSAIRAHALGKFRDLLGATVKHPAMLFYLDNWRNTDPNSVGAKGPFKGLNENYARELMELHTLGANGGYSQADVESLTKTLTGWSVVHNQQPSTEENGFVFAADRHDSSIKKLLGKTLLGQGVEEGDRALDLLASHPATARHISYKLAQFFVADEPPTTLVSRLAEQFLATQGDIAETLLALFESSEFWEAAYYQRKFKTPYQYLLSMVRAMGVSAPSPEVLTRLGGLMNQLGMPLYRCQTPNGYAQTEVAWLSPDVMMRRVSMAIATTNIVRGNKPDPAVLLTTLENQLTAADRGLIDDAPKPLQAALMLGSPSMMYR